MSLQTGHAQADGQWEQYWTKDGFFPNWTGPCDYQKLTGQNRHTKSGSNPQV